MGHLVLAVAEVACLEQALVHQGVEQVVRLAQAHTQCARPVGVG